MGDIMAYGSPGECVEKLPSTADGLLGNPDAVGTAARYLAIFDSMMDPQEEAFSLPARQAGREMLSAGLASRGIN